MGCAPMAIPRYLTSFFPLREGIHDWPWISWWGRGTIRWELYCLTYTQCSTDCSSRWARTGSLILSHKCYLSSHIQLDEQGFTKTALDITTKDGELMVWHSCCPYVLYFDWHRLTFWQAVTVGVHFWYSCTNCDSRRRQCYVGRGDKFSE